MSTTAILRKLGPLVVGVAVLLPVGQASAHIQVLTPNGGEELEIGSTFEIRWTIVIQHNQLNWDLWYSTNSNAGPWTTVAMNLPAGSSAVGSQHTYCWTIPDDPDDTVWVRVRMDNTGTDYSHGPHDDSTIRMSPKSTTPLPSRSAVQPPHSREQNNSAC